MSNDVPASFGVQSLSDSLETGVDLDDLQRIDFEAHWGDPVESDHTGLDDVPDDAVIDFGNGTVKDSSIQFIIKRAMVDPDATVLPNGDT